MIRIRPRRACSRTCRSSSAPGPPTSLNPAEITIAPRTPASTHSPITSGTVAAGVTITARSTGSGTSPIVGYALIPSTFGRFGLTGKTVPPNGLLIRFQRTVRPTLPYFSVAPMTATVLGAKIASSDLRLRRQLVRVLARPCPPSRPRPSRSRVPLRSVRVATPRPSPAQGRHPPGEVRPGRPAAVGRFAGQPLVGRALRRRKCGVPAAVATTHGAPPGLIVCEPRPIRGPTERRLSAPEARPARPARYRASGLKETWHR